MFPAHTERKENADYVINGLVFKSAVVDVDYENAGAMLNNVISDVRKAKASHKLALNKPITLININVPDAYYNTVLAAREELREICKAGEVKVERGKEYSVFVQI
jgi:valyl-tRNA synthetase